MPFRVQRHDFVPQSAQPNYFENCCHFSQQWWNPKKANIFFDEGSSLSYITTQLAKEHFTGTELQIPQVETLRRSKRIASRPRPQYVESVNEQSRLTAILLTCGVNSAHAQRQKKPCSTARDTAMLEFVLVVYSLRFIKCCHWVLFCQKVLILY